ncbi:MAG: AAA family ATPase [Bacteroidota bacterium]
MIRNDLIEELINLDRLAKEEGSKYPIKRFLFPRLKYLLTETRQMAGISGLRGTGKTILLRQLAAELDHSFYLSADTLPPGTILFDLVIRFGETFGTKYVMVDEIHALSDWQGQIKKIYDFSAIRIIFTSSSSIELSEGKHDLSRRLTLQSLPLFSFREYLLFRKKVEIPVITLDEIMASHTLLYQKVFSYESDFLAYSTLGALPACLESPLSSVIVAIVDKVIQKDMLSAARLSQEDLLNIRIVMLFIARAGVEGCSYSSVSRNTGITKYKAQQYIGLMHAASMLRIVLPYGANVLPEPKILFAPALRANLAQGIDDDRLKGAIREEFFIHHVTGANLTVNYLKSLRGQKLPDYILFHKGAKLIFEIGGTGKKSSQFKGMDMKEKHILTQPGSTNGIPLILFGFLY